MRNSAWQLQREWVDESVGRDSIMSHIGVAGRQSL
ncbi:MAG: hypothetical protein ACI9XZ_004525, partial [Alphaproteobacteria bacterium]